MANVQLIHMWWKFFVFFALLFVVGIGILLQSYRMLDRNPSNDPKISDYDLYKKTWEGLVAGGWFITTASPVICFLIYAWGIAH